MHIDQLLALIDIEGIISRFNKLTSLNPFGLVFQTCKELSPTQTPWLISPLTPNASLVMLDA